MLIDLLERLLDLLRDSDNVDALVADPQGFLAANGLADCDPAEFAEALPLVLAELPGGPELLAACPPVATWAEIGPAEVLVHAVGGATSAPAPWAAPAPAAEHVAPTPPVDAPAVDAPVVHAPVADAPPAADVPVVEEPAAEAPVDIAPPAAEVPAEVVEIADPPVAPPAPDIPPVNEVDIPAVDAPPADEPTADVGPGAVDEAPADSAPPVDAAPPSPAPDPSVPLPPVVAVPPSPAPDPADVLPDASAPPVDAPLPPAVPGPDPAPEQPPVNVAPPAPEPDPVPAEPPVVVAPPAPEPTPPAPIEDAIPPVPDTAPPADAIAFPADGSGAGPNDDFDGDGRTNAEEGFFDRNGDGLLTQDEIDAAPNADGDSLIDAEESGIADADGDGTADQFDTERTGTFEDNLPPELQDIANDDAQNAIDAIDGFAAPAASGFGAGTEAPAVDDGTSIVKAPTGSASEPEFGAGENVKQIGADSDRDVTIPLDDGSVRFVSEEIDRSTLEQLGDGTSNTVLFEEEPAQEPTLLPFLEEDFDSLAPDSNGVGVVDE